MSIVLENTSSRENSCDHVRMTHRKSRVTSRLRMALHRRRGTVVKNQTVATPNHKMTTTLHGWKVATKIDAMNREINRFKQTTSFHSYVVSGFVF